VQRDGREKRVRRLLEKHGYVLRKSYSKDKLHPAYCRYMILDIKHNVPIVGHEPHLYSLDLDGVEAWLGRQDGA
jgi:hypothetical protein